MKFLAEVFGAISLMFSSIFGLSRTTPIPVAPILETKSVAQVTQHPTQNTPENNPTAAMTTEEKTNISVAIDKNVVGYDQDLTITWKTSLVPKGAYVELVLFSEGSRHGPSIARVDPATGKYIWHIPKDGSQREVPVVPMPSYDGTYSIQAWVVVPPACAATNTCHSESFPAVIAKAESSVFTVPKGSSSEVTADEAKKLLQRCEVVSVDAREQTVTSGKVTFVTHEKVTLMLKSGRSVTTIQSGYDVSDFANQTRNSCPDLRILQ